MRSWAARSAAAESAIAVLLLEVIEIDLLSEQVLVEPVRDVLQPRDAVGRLPRTRQRVILAGERHHDRDSLLCFQCPEHLAAFVSAWCEPHYLRISVHNLPLGLLFIELV